MYNMYPYTLKINSELKPMNAYVVPYIKFGAALCYYPGSTTLGIKMIESEAYAVKTCQLEEFFVVVIFVPIEFSTRKFKENQSDVNR
jgi:hypothetical protein